MIKGLPLSNEQWSTDLETITREAVTHFQGLFAKKVANESVSARFTQICLSSYDKHLSDKDIQSLSHLGIEAEVYQALKSLGPLKALGPDESLVVSFDKLWPTVATDVQAGALQLLNLTYLLKETNLTYITLIPKCNSPQGMLDFRPISLCNTVYKVVAKCLVNRLRTVLVHLINSNQNACIPCKLIVDTCREAYELLNYLKGKKQWVSYATIKVDLNKAYDRVKWEFLFQLLLRLRFPQQWVSMLMQCVIVGFQVIYFLNRHRLIGGIFIKITKQLITQEINNCKGLVIT